MNEKRKELNRLLFEEGYISCTVCPENEQKQFQLLKEEQRPLPDDVLYDEDEKHFVRWEKTGLSAEDFRLLIMLKQKRDIGMIRSILVGFFILFITIFVLSFFR